MGGFSSAYPDKFDSDFVIKIYRERRPVNTIRRKTSFDTPTGGLKATIPEK
jgi:hypothetical protein